MAASANSPIIGFIGLGQMGGSMAMNILAKRGALCVYDASAESMAALVEHGAHACSSPAELAAQCNLIVLCLPYTPAVHGVIFDTEGLLKGWESLENKAQALIIDTTTLDRADALGFGEKLRSHSITYCDSPVSGLPKRAKDGTLTVMFGGSKESFDRSSAILDCFGESVIHCGELGSGQAMKAVNNIIYNINIAALCEVLPVAVANGLDPLKLADLVTSGSSRSFAAEHFVAKMLKGQFDGDFAMQDAYKDIVNMQGMAADVTANTPLTKAMVATYEQAMSMGFGEQAKSAMLKVYEEQLGVTFRH